MRSSMRLPFIEIFAGKGNRILNWERLNLNMSSSVPCLDTVHHGNLIFS